MPFCSSGYSISQSLGDLSNQLLLLLIVVYHNQPSIRSTGILRGVGISGRACASGVEVAFDEVYGVFLVRFVLSRPHPGLARQSVTNIALVSISDTGVITGEAI